jgi:trigger factor
MKEKIVVSCIALDNDLIADDDDIAAYRQKLVEDNDLEDESVIDTYYTSDDLMFYATEENVLDFLMERGVQVESTEETTEETEADAETEAEEDSVSGDDTEADVDTEAE